MFDCSAKYHGKSRNDELLQGPDLTNSLVEVLTRFRQDPVAYMSDVEAMFHQDDVNPKDQSALRFLWWPDGNLDLEPEEFMITTHLFGAVSSPVNQGPLQSIQNVRGIKIGSLNIASLCKHFDELCIVMENQPFDILAINETRLDKSIPDSLIHLPGYSLSRFDLNRNGGGVCAYIRSSINFRRRTSLESDNPELLALEVNKPNSKPFLVCCWYRPPHSPVECFDLFEQLVNKAESYYTDIT